MVCALWGAPDESLKPGEQLSLDSVPAKMTCSAIRYCIEFKLSDGVGRPASSSSEHGLEAKGMPSCIVMLMRRSAQTEEA
jgi:hypothetical protein